MKYAETLLKKSRALRVLERPRLSPALSGVTTVRDLGSEGTVRRWRWPQPFAAG